VAVAPPPAAASGRQRLDLGQANAMKLTRHQSAVRALSERLASTRAEWIHKNSYFYSSDHRYLRLLVPEGASVLEIGCGNGQLLAALKPRRGVGIDISESMIALARAEHPEYEFHVANAEDPAAYENITGPFDTIILADTVGYLEDCQGVFMLLRRLVTPRTRVIVAYYSHLWEPLLNAGERLGLKMPQDIEQSWLSTDDIMNLLVLSDYEVVGREWRVLLPRRLLGIGEVVNRFIAPLPGIRRLCLRHYVVARTAPMARVAEDLSSATVLVPCRNERGNIESAVARLPRFAPDIEIIFVEGHSSDGTYEECLRVRDAYPHLDIKVFRQDGKGKGDAVRKGFANARGDILMILDADLTVPPEQLGKFYEALVTRRCEFANGSRFVYPMESNAMRYLNWFANRAFAAIFSYLLNQRLTDTLCGTKVLWRTDYERIVANRKYFGDFDPFGDFDLIFGAARLNLKIMDIPIRYAERTYGTTQISRFRQGAMLARMVAFAFLKLKAI
jgi:SAM-dependent methyltransferase